MVLINDADSGVGFLKEFSDNGKHMKDGRDTSVEGRTKEQRAKRRKYSTPTTYVLWYI